MYPPKREPTGPGQRSVWDFPRPPTLEQWHESVEVYFGGQRIAATTEAWCALETSHPPTYYLPHECFVAGSLHPTRGSSHCEWKGRASYFDIVAGDCTALQAAWSYPLPTARFAPIAHHISLYAAQVDKVLIDGVPALPQPGNFYGGWVTDKVTGPFKGIPGSMGW